MSIVEDNYSVTTRLLTLLNVSALSTKKRKRDEERQETLPPPKKLNAKKATAVGIVDKTNQDSSVENEDEITTGDKQGSLDDTKEPESMSILYTRSLYLTIQHRR